MISFKTELALMAHSFYTFLPNYHGALATFRKKDSIQSSYIAVAPVTSVAPCIAEFLGSDCKSFSSLICAFHFNLFAAFLLWC